MTPQQYQIVKQIFLDARQLPPEQRAAHVATLAGGDQLIATMVLGMLEQDTPEVDDRSRQQIRMGLEDVLRQEAESHAIASDGQPPARPGTTPPFAPPPLGPATTPRTTSGVPDNVPELIGQYRILRRIGSGGMGDVYEAQQDSPRRSVAIKLMRRGLGSEALARRFRREVEFVGRLSHPGIAKVYQAGMTIIGGLPAPYYAMEFVPGLPLTRYATSRELPIPAKLRLFASICDAVQYAHQQGIIHRDLKPANILVQDGETTTSAKAGTSGEGTTGTGDRAAREVAGNAMSSGMRPPTGWGAQGPQARILDFGIARAVAPDDRTASGAGTPSAPDATGLEANGLGEPSTEGNATDATGATEAGQIIGTVPYMSPEQISGRAGQVDTRTDVYALGVILFELLTGKLPFATDGLSIVEAAALKSTGSPLRLGAVDPSFRGDLETIVAKALEPEKHRRYASASELASDVRRYLADEVITARPATVLYQLAKFAKRNRPVVAAAGVAAIAVITGLIATAVAARVAINQRDAAIASAAEAANQRQIAERASAEATAQTAVARKKSFVAESVAAILLDTLEQATPNVSPGKEPLLIEAIEYAEAQAFDPEAINSPEVQAVVLHSIGIIRRERGDYERAEKDLTTALAQRRKVLSPNDPNLADTLTNVGLLRKKQGRLADAAALMQEAVDVQRRSPEPDDLRLGRNLYNLGGIYVLLRELDKGRACLDESLTLVRRVLGDEHEIIGIHLSARAKLAIEENKWDEAQAFADRALAMYRKVVGPSHPSIASGLRECAEICAHNGDTKRALEMLLEADRMAQEVFPDSLMGRPGATNPTDVHPTRRGIREALIAALRQAGRGDEAAQLEATGADALAAPLPPTQSKPQINNSK